MIDRRLMKRKKRCVLGLLVLLVLTGCARQKEPIQKTGLYFNTVIQITLYDDSEKELIEQCFQMADRYEKMLSVTCEDSDVWKMNHAGGQSVIVSEETGYLLEEALRYSVLTEGYVDPTIGALSSLWDFSSNEEKTVPSQTDIQNALEKIGYEKIRIENKADGYEVCLTEGAQIDLGFIAKGYIADKMKEYLIANNVEHGIINLGGNVLTIGTKPTGELFSIGIKKPFSEHGETITDISVNDKSVVSSGIYERCFESDGKLYHHILNTKTGYPIENDLYHVTIISDSSMQGDALSTACLVLGKEKGMELIEQTPGCEAVFVTNTYEIYKTSGLN